MLRSKGSFSLLIPLLVTFLLLACSRPKDEISGVLQRGTSYDSSVPHKHKFGKLLLASTNGQTYAIREVKGFHVLDAAGNRLSEPDGQYPLNFGSDYRLIGRIIELSDAKRVLRTGDQPSDLWYPQEATVLMDVERMILTKAALPASP